MNRKKIISVVGGCNGAGSTFLSTSLALIMAQYKEGITYLEGVGHSGRHSLPVYELSLDKHISPIRFVDFFSLKADGKPINNRVNLYADVNWIVRTKENSQLIEPHEVAGEYIIWDNPPILEGSDLIIYVIDVLPSKVLAAKESITCCKEKYKSKIVWLFNRVDMVQYVKAAENFLKIKGDFYIPSQPQEDFYKAQSLCAALMDPGNRHKTMFPKPLPKMNAAMEELAQYVLTLY